MELYQQVKQLQAAGWKIRQIARRLDLNHTTVRKFFYAEAFLERTRRLAGGSILEPYLTYMEERFREGLRNGLQLWREIKQRGYPGTNRQVSKWISKRRQQEQAREVYKDITISTGSSVVAAPPTVDEVPSARQRTSDSSGWLGPAWLMIRQPERLEQEEREILSCVEQNVQVKQVYALAQQFIKIVHKREASNLDQWLKDAKASGILMLQSLDPMINVV